MEYSLQDVQHVAVANITTVTTIVAAPATGYRIIVLGYTLSVDAAGEILWSSAANSLTGLVELVADTPMVVYSPTGVLKCNPAETLRLTSTTAANGHVSYIVRRC